MTPELKSKLDLIDILKDVRKGKGKELDQILDKRQIAILEKEGRFFSGGSYKPKRIISPKIEKALKKIPVPEKYSAKTYEERIKALKIVYKDLKTDKTSKDIDYSPSNLWRAKKILGYKIRKKDYFFFAWLLIQSADLDKKKCKKSIKHNWWIVCKLMELITGKKKFLNDYDSKGKKREKLYRTVKEHIKILIKAYWLLNKADLEIEGMKKISKSYDQFFLKYPREMIRLEVKYGYDLNLAHRIHAFLVDHDQESKNPVRIGDIYDYFSNRRKKDIYPCLWFLVRVGEIFGDMTNKKIYYLGDGRDLKEVCPTVFPDFLRSELSRNARSIS